jgi:glycosyltransferase involved in cell wall biosynthesis
MYRGMTVGVVVPAYNEAGNVGEVIESLPAFVDRAYVIDDGSTDGTWAEIRTAAARRNEDHDGEFEQLVVPISHEHNRGVGGAIKTGYLRARDEGIEATAVLGGDGQMDPTALTAYLDPIADGVAGYAKGNRFARPADWAAMPRFRFVGNVLLSYLTKIASGYWGLMDSQNGYTAISLAALEATDIEGMYEYYGYCNDLLVRLNAAGVRVADVPRSAEFAYEDGWSSHISYTEYIPRVSVMLLRGFLRRVSRQYLITDYHPAGLLYLVGTVLSGVTALGALGSLADRDREGGSSSLATWVLGLAAGVAVFLQASLLDRDENEHLEHRIGPEASDGREAGEEGVDPHAGAEHGPEQRRQEPHETRIAGDGDSDSRPVEGQG